MIRVTWKNLIEEEMKKNKEVWSDIVHSAHPLNTSLEDTFNGDWGTVEGCPFTVWTKNYTYFPMALDGEERVGSVPRNPGGEPKKIIEFYSQPFN